MGLVVRVLNQMPALTKGGQVVAYSPAGDVLVAAGGDPMGGSKAIREAVAWRESGESLWEFRDRGRFFGDVAFSPDGRRLLGAEQGPHVTELDAATGKAVRRFEAHPRNSVWGVAFAPDGSQFATASWDMTVKLWPAMGGAARLTLKADESSSYSSVRFSPDGRLVAAGSSCALTVWAADSGKLLHDGPGASDIAFHPDGSHVLAAGEGSKGKGMIRAVDTAKWKSLWTRAAHKRSCDSVTYAPHGRLLATSGEDKQILLWDAAGKQVAKLKDHILSEFGVVGLAWTPDGSRLACIDGRGPGQPGQVTVYAVEGG
jgi:WD40 repeat protein